MRTMKLALIGIVGLAAAALAPSSASAGAVWTDGNWYARCPDSISNTRLTTDPLPTSQWENEWVVFGAYTRVPFVEAWAGGNVMSCYYAITDSLRFELRDIAPAPYTKCVAYSPPWFRCTK